MLLAMLTQIQEGGWTRQTTIRELPSSVELAGVNMRLDEGVIRELHWHKEAEWAYVLEGEVRVTAIDYEGGNFMDDLKKGDLWVSYLSSMLCAEAHFHPVFPQRCPSLPARAQSEWNRVLVDV